MIMIADDDLFIRKTMVKILAPFGTVIQVERGDDVLPSYIEHNPDILLLDIHCPDETASPPLIKFYVWIRMRILFS